MYKILAKTLFVGRKLHYLPTCHSTNDIASELLAQKKATEGTLIVTDDQIAGRGQRGNAWESVPYQNVTLSVVLLPNFLHPKDQFLMTMMISVALIDLLCAFLPDGLKIKWPNDIYYYDRKIAGILIESAIQQEDIESTIIGIGLNVNQSQFITPNAISLFQITNRQFHLEGIISRLCETMEKRYLELKGGDWTTLKSTYTKSLYRLNQVHRFQSTEAFTGKIRGVEDTGKLCIEVNGKILTFDFKEVKFIA